MLVVGSVHSNNLQFFFFFKKGEMLGEMSEGSRSLTQLSPRWAGSPRERGEGECGTPVPQPMAAAAASLVSTNQAVTAVV